MQEIEYFREEIRKKYHDLFEYSLDLIYVHDFRGRFIDANEKTLSSLGFKEEEIGNIFFKDLIDKEQKEKAFKVLREIKEFGKQLNLSEFKLRKKNGEFIYVETYGIPLWYKDRIYGILGVAKDITVKKKAEKIITSFNLYLEQKVKKKIQKLKESENTLKERLKELDCLYQLSIISETKNLTIDEIINKIIKIIPHAWQFPEDLCVKIKYRSKTYKSADFKKTKWVQTSSVKIKDDLLIFQIFYLKALPFLNEEQLLLDEISKRLRFTIEKWEIEQGLKESEEKYRLISENANDMIAVLNNNFEYEYLNEKIHQQILGYSKEDLIGKNNLPFLHADDRKEALLAVSKILRKSKGSNQVRFLKKDGTYLWLEITGRVFFDSKGVKKILMISRDITERKQKEQELRESEEKFRTLFESSQDGIVMASLDGNILDCNQTFLQMLGYTMEEIKNLNFFKITPQEWTTLEDNIISNQLLVRGFSEIYEKEIIKKNGEKIPVSINLWLKLDEIGTIKALWAIVRDITGRKKAEHQLRQSEEKYRDLFTNSPNGIILVNGDGIIIEVNPIIEMLLGYKSDYFIGKSIKKLDILVSNNKINLGEIMSELSNNDTLEPIELQIKKENGELSWIHLQPSRIKRGKQYFFQWVIQDINMRKEIDRLRDKFTLELEHAVSKRTMELNLTLAQQQQYLDQIIKSSQFKTEFLASMSHELRTPLNAIIGFTDLLIEGTYGELNEEQLDFLEDIRSSAQYQFEMIQNILDITKIESGQLHLKIQKFSLNIMIDQVKSTFKPMCAKKNLKFIIKGLKTPIEITADPIRFKEILFNLIGNAIKFTIEGEVVLDFKEDQKNWLFNVRDTGIGIANKDYDVIFKEFKRVDSTYVNSTPGTGLGLSLTKRLINLHGGNITFSSVLGMGTTFTFNIPKIRYSE